MISQPKHLAYQRLLLKLSGEALQGSRSASFDAAKLGMICEEIKQIIALGVQVGIVVGGGNLIRGSELTETSIDRIVTDHMGMLATVINGLALQDVLKRQGVPVVLMSAIAVPGLVPIYERMAARDALAQNNVVIFVAGTGNPLVTTDTAAALRGVELSAELVIKATKVDGVFAADPIKNPKAERYTSLTYDEVLEQRLWVMDMNAILLCKNNKLPLRVMNMNNKGALLAIVKGESIGTLVSD